MIFHSIPLLCILWLRERGLNEGAGSPLAHMSGIDASPATCSSAPEMPTLLLWGQKRSLDVCKRTKRHFLRLTFEACFASCDFHSLLAEVGKGRKTCLSSRVRLVYSLLSLSSLSEFNDQFNKNKHRSRKKNLVWTEARPFGSGCPQESSSLLSFLANFTSLLGMICLLLLTPYSTADRVDIETISQNKLYT